MLCADPSLSSTTSRATPASSTTEPLPIKPIRAWRDPPPATERWWEEERRQEGAREREQNHIERHGREEEG